MAFVGWNCYATVSNVSQMLWFSLLTPVNVVFFPVFRTGFSNTFGAERDYVRGEM